MDNVLNSLLPFLQQCDRPTLWLADENALDALNQLEGNNNNLFITTNRFDIYQIAIQKNIGCEFSDFLFEHLPFKPERIIYRVSKEKALVHHLLNCASQLLAPDGELIITGKKQDGIKSYAQKLVTQLGATGKLKKQKTEYLGSFSQLNPSTPLESQNYTELHKVECNHDSIKYFYSKPGVFGWQKIDTGTQLLLETIAPILEKTSQTPENILDLGCGYGWIFINLPTLLHSEDISITATDNNATALRCAQKNAEFYAPNTQIIATDCGDSIKKSFDLILCNPPFHQGHSHAKKLTEKFLQNTYRLLDKQGTAFFVVNEFIKLEFNGLQIEEIKRHHGFKVVSLRKVK